MLCAVFISLSEAEMQQPLTLMPMPAKVQLGEGRLLIDTSFSVAIAGTKERDLRTRWSFFSASSAGRPECPRLI